MFSWGEDSQRLSELLTGETNTATQGGVDSLELSYQIWDLAAGHSLLSVVKSNGEAFIIRTQRGGRQEQSEHGQYIVLLCKT